MEMHKGGQDKTIPIYRTIHAAQESIDPLTHADHVDVHGGLSCVSSYPTAAKPCRPPRMY